MLRHWLAVLLKRNHPITKISAKLEILLHLFSKGIKSLKMLKPSHPENFIYSNKICNAAKYITMHVVLG